MYGNKSTTKQRVFTLLQHTIKQSFTWLIDTDDYQPMEAVKYGFVKCQFLFDKALDTYITPGLEKEYIEKSTEGEKNKTELWNSQLCCWGQLA